jgi:hypothetical protein
MYYLFLDADMRETYNKIISIETPGLSFDCINKNSMLPECLIVHSMVFKDARVKLEITRIMNRIEYKNKFQILKSLMKSKVM